MTTQQEPSATFITDEESKFVNTKRVNVKSDLIEITEDKLENILLKHLNNLHIKKAWVVPFSIFVSVFLANLTSNFTDKYGVSGQTWGALFFLLSIASGIWLIFTVIRFAITKEKTTIEYLICVIKNSPRVTLSNSTGQK